MARTGVVIDPRFMDHTNPPGHPERADRLRVLIEMMDGYEREGIVRFDPRPATATEIGWIHESAHIANVAESATREFTRFDGDTRAVAKSYETALLAAGAPLVLIDAILGGEIDNGFALARPPGHHAEADRAMGFCFFNNVAIAARYLQERHGLARVAIMDWDVHHGNGTQHTFERDASVLYLSIHQYPFYPGTGAAEDTGLGEGEGFTVNLPLPADCGDAEYLEGFRRLIDPITRQFRPDFLLISAGYDAHALDPLGGMEVTAPGFATMARMLLRVAGDVCEGRCLAVLEGGYDLEGLTESVRVTLDEMGGPRPEIAPAGDVSRFDYSPILKIQSKRWEV